MTGGCLGALHCAARLLLFVGGPSTEGGGKVVDKELSEPIRSHKARRRPRRPQGRMPPCRPRCLAAHSRAPVAHCLGPRRWPLAATCESAMRRRDVKRAIRLSRSLCC